MLLADYRMPQMNGIEFLEQAMDLFPLARRVLLTAYADTDAAIQAINVVDLDHYLLKPWDPPEEKLYPVVDELLEAWTAVDHRPARETRVVGHRWSARSYEVRDFLARNSVPYRWYLGRRAGGRSGCSPPPAWTAAGCRVVVTADGERAGRADRRRAGRPGRAGHHPVRRLLRPGRRRRRPGRARRRGLRRRRRGCAPCWSSGGPPAGRPARAAGSRTTSASRTACPARS